MTTRGIRNNNPGNIDRNATKWQGMADDQSSDPRFCVFKTPQDGIRALAKVLLTYQSHDGCRTPRQVIARWAPPSENNTGAYLAAFCAALGVGADDLVDLDSSAMMTPAVKAIILHENGVNPYSDAVIAEGVRRAGVADAKPPPVAKQPQVQMQAAAIGTGCVAWCVNHLNAAANYAPELKKALDSMSGYAGVPIVHHTVTILGTVAGGLALVGLGLTILHLRRT